MPNRTPLPSSQALGDSLIARVMSLMAVPFHLLPRQAQDERAELGWRRLSETLSSVPFYRKAAQNHPSGPEAYWRGFWMSQVNLVHPPIASSTPAVDQLSPAEIDSLRSEMKNASAWAKEQLAKAKKT